MFCSHNDVCRYGDVVDIGALNALLIIFQARVAGSIGIYFSLTSPQLVFAGVIVLCLDELLEKVPLSTSSP